MSFCSHGVVGTWTVVLAVVDGGAVVPDTVVDSVVGAIVVVPVKQISLIVLDLSLSY